MATPKRAIATPSVHWRAETDGRIDGVPVISDGVVFIGNQEHHMYALDAETGLPIWSEPTQTDNVDAAAVGPGL